jgi:hypothetical protein
MPINNVGYRAWNGSTRGSVARMLAIATTGLKISFKSQWIRRMLFVSWLPVAYFGILLFVFEQIMDEQNRSAAYELQLVRAAKAKLEAEVGARNMLDEALSQQERPLVMPRGMRDSLSWLPKSKVWLDTIEQGDASGVRHATWCFLLMNFLGYFQNYVMLVLIGLIVPPLISRDLRSRAYLMYFSRPIGRIEYFVGKAIIPATFLALITLVPAMTLYIFGVMLSPGFSVVLDTWDIPVRIVIASSVLIVPTSLLALMFSSLTYESRFATFAWFATWGLGAGAYAAINLAQLERQPIRQIGPPEPMTDWSYLSIHATVARVQEWVFGMEPEWLSAVPFFAVLGGVSLIATGVLLYRVAVPVNA